MTYEVDADYNELKEKYPLEQIAGEGTDEERSFRLLFWIAEHIKHKGDYDGHVQNTALALFEYAFDTENGINCAALSMALTECLLAVGIKARAVFIHPFSPYDCDNHVVCEAWSKERKKWMMLANIQYREELCGKQEWLEQRKKMLAGDVELIYQDLEALYDN